MIGAITNCGFCVNQLAKRVSKSIYKSSSTTRWSNRNTSPQQQMFFFFMLSNNAYKKNSTNTLITMYMQAEYIYFSYLGRNRLRRYVNQINTP